MDDLVCQELERVAQALARPVPILRDVLTVDAASLAQVREVVVKYHPCARGNVDDPRPKLHNEDVWGAVEDAAHYTRILGRPIHAYDVLCYYDRTVRIEGASGATFADYQKRLRSLLWAFAGQPGRLDSEALSESIGFFLSLAAREELRWRGNGGVAYPLNALLDALGAKVVVSDVTAEAHWGGAGQAGLVGEPTTAPIEGAFWRKVFGAFRDAFVLNPPTDLRTGHRDLSRAVKAGRKRLHLPRHPVPQPRGSRARRFDEAVRQTAELSNKGLAPKQIARQMGAPDRTVYHRLKVARERGLLKP